MQGFAKAPECVVSRPSQIFQEASAEGNQLTGRARPRLVLA